MGQAIGAILPLAIAVAISPVPIIAIVLVLGTRGARVNGLTFTLGWLVGLSVVGALVLIVIGRSATGDAGEPATWASTLKLAFGVLLLLMAARLWRGLPKHGQEAPLPKWTQAVDDFTAAKWLGMGVLLSAANPKNLVLTAAAAAAIAETGIPGGEEAIALAVFVLLGSLTILAAATAYLVLGSRADGALGSLKSFMAAHNAAIMTVLLLLIGAKLVGDAIASFS